MCENDVIQGRTHQLGQRQHQLVAILLPSAVVLTATLTAKVHVTNNYLTHREAILNL